MMHAVHQLSMPLNYLNLHYAQAQLADPERSGEDTHQGFQVGK